MCIDLHFSSPDNPPKHHIKASLSTIYRNVQKWRSGCISPRCLRVLGQRPGCTLTTLFGTTDYKEISTTPAAPRKKHSWLPVLTVLFMISYGLMTMLIVEQGQTIESQRALIRELFRDSTELSAARLKEHRAQQAQNPKSSAPSAQAPSTQVPDNQAPSTQDLAKQAPSTQAPQQRAQIQTKPKQFQMPSKPAADLTDHRRALITI